MPEDPLALLNQNMAAVFGSFSKGMAQVGANFAQGMQGMMGPLAEMAPHNVLPKLAQNMSQGTGYFNAKMTTANLNKKLIY